MHLHNEAPPLMGSSITDGGNDNAKVVATSDYRIGLDLSTAEYPTRLVASRFRLTISTAREVCRMAGIGVRS